MQVLPKQIKCTYAMTIYFFHKLAIVIFEHITNESQIIYHSFLELYSSVNHVTYLTALGLLGLKVILENNYV